MAGQVIGQLLVCNCGSSSIKVNVLAYSDAKHDALQTVAKAVVERIGSDEALVTFKMAGEKLKLPVQTISDHQHALSLVTDTLMEHGYFPPEQRLAIGHRVVHGGPVFSAPALIDEEAKTAIKQCAEYAPLHNPANLMGIEACESLYDVPQVAVFDTGFHARMPAYASTYAIPSELAEKYQIRRYGFHGTSHEYVSQQAAKRLGVDYADSTWITLHLGNGASACAIKNGVSIDTSMGYTPVEGLVMGTRCGDIDPAIVALLQEKQGLSTDEVDLLLNKQSGLKGIAGMNDMRDILDAVAEGDEQAELALDVFCYRIRKYVGSYLAALGGDVDGIIFTAGIGEHADEVRYRVLDGLDVLGVSLDEMANREGQGIISSNESPIPVLVVPTDEALMIAQHTVETLGDDLVNNVQKAVADEPSVTDDVEDGNLPQDEDSNPQQSLF